MSIYISIVILAISALFVLYNNNDILYPGFLVLLPWIFFLTLLLFGDLQYDKNSLAYLYITIGLLLFEVGCNTGKNNVERNARFLDVDEEYVVNYTLLKIIIVVESAFLVYAIGKYYSFIVRNWKANIFISYYTNRENFDGATLIGYMRNMFTAFAICLVVAYSHVPETQKGRYRKYIYFQTIILIILSATRFTRNGIMLALLPFFTAIIIVTRRSNRQVKRIVILGIIAFVALFSIISILKYYYLFSSGEYVSTIAKQFEVYGTGGIVAFQVTIQNPRYGSTISALPEKAAFSASNTPI